MLFEQCLGHVLQASYEPPKFPEFSSASDKPSAWKGDLLALLVHKEDLSVADNEDKTVSVAEGSQLADLDKQLDGIVAEMLEAGDFKGEKVRATPSHNLSAAVTEDHNCTALVK